MSQQYLTSGEALAMGNAHVAVADDGYALFYNPAGLARTNRWAFYPLAGGLGFTSGFLSAADALTNTSGVVNKINAMAGKRVFFDTYIFPHFQMPYFSGGFIGRARAQQYIRNPVYPTMSSDIFLEWGVVGGFAFPIWPGIVDFGASVKYVARYKALSFASVDSDELLSAVQNNSFANYMRKGSGYSSNVGISVTLPTGSKDFKPVLGLCWEDIGTLTFHNGNNSQPKRIEQSLNVGMALNYAIPYVGQLTFALDIRRLLNDEIEYPQKLHVGVRMKFPTVTLYGGLSGGWLSGGAKFDFKVMSINILTYEEEIGNYAGARGDRRYMIEGKIGFDIEGFKLGKMTKRRR